MYAACDVGKNGIESARKLLHAAINASSYCYIRVLILLQLSSGLNKMVLSPLESWISMQR
jgi:hypothetical protein